MSAAAKIAPVLAAGCPIVFKPTSETPLDVFVLADAAEAAGIPPGVLNIVPGDADVGATIVAHPGVDRVLFTGSTTTGRAIAQASAGSMKRLTLELGGKATAILLDDTPIEESLRNTLPMSFFNSGQACIALSRVLAHRDRYDDVVEAAAAIAGEMTLGDPHDESTVLGPVISARHHEHVESHIEAACTGAARVSLGAGRGQLDRGWYVEPTIFAVDNGMRLTQEEVFGPVLTIIPHDGDDDSGAHRQRHSLRAVGHGVHSDTGSHARGRIADQGRHLRRERVHARLLVAVRRAQAVGNRQRVRRRGSQREHRSQGDHVATGHRRHRTRLKEQRPWPTR